MKLYDNQATWHRSTNHMCSQPCHLQSGPCARAVPIDEAPGPGSREAEKADKGTSWSNSRKLVTIFGAGRFSAKSRWVRRASLQCLVSLKAFLAFSIVVGISQSFTTVEFGANKLPANMEIRSWGSMWEYSFRWNHHRPAF